MKNFQCEKFYKILDYYKLLFASQHKLLIFSLHLLVFFRKTILNSIWRLSLPGNTGFKPTQPKNYHKWAEETKAH